jgi:hypothetical protein
MLAGMVAAVAVQAHDHFAAGFVDTNENGSADAGEPLQLVDGPAPGRLFRLLPRPLGFWPTIRCGGYYALDERPRTLFPNDAFAFTVLSNGENDEPRPETPHDGAWVWIEIVSVAGPPGGRLGFWDANWSQFYQQPTVTFPANQPTTGAGEGRFFVLSEGGNNPFADPFGHIHRRSWTADKPGEYRVGFRLVDRSTSGPGGGPWHAPSAVFTFVFEAGPDFQPSITRSPDGVIGLSWPTRMGIHVAAAQTGVVFAVERSGTLAPEAGHRRGRWLEPPRNRSRSPETPPGPGPWFYRLRYAWSEP